MATALLMALAAATPAAAAAFDVPRVDTVIVVDGVPDEEAWQRIRPLPLTTLYPAFDSPPTERTEIRIAYDDRYLFGAIRAFDSEPRRILANTLYRDRWIGDDEFAIILDTFADGESGAMFLVTPAGVRVDNQLSNDAEPGRGTWMHRDWNVPWDAAARITGEGWTAEMRIPWSSLAFRVEEGVVRMRLKTYRYLPRKGENQIYPATRPDAAAQPHFTLSLGQPVAFHGLRAPRPLRIWPFIRAGGSRVSRGTGRDARLVEHAREVAPGLDLKHTAAATALDVTVNTDFAQVEADDAQLNLTRFSLLFPEKRPFFQERAGLFSIGTGGDSSIFYSRRIGLGEDGTPAPIRTGARLVTRLAGWDVGILNTQVGAVDADESATQTAAENMGIVRVRRPLGRWATMGGAVTHRVGGGRRNLVWATDGTTRLGRHHRLTWVWAQSRDERTGPGVRGGRALIRFQRELEQGLSYAAEYRSADAGYEPGLGFVQARDFREALASVGQRWRPRATALRSLGWRLDNTARYRRADGRADELGTRLAWTFETRTNVELRAGGAAVHEDVARAFDPTPALTIRPGTYDSVTGFAALSTPSDRRLRLSSTVEAGTFYGGRRTTVRVSPLWAHSRHLELALDHERTHLDVAGTGQTAHVVRARARVAVTARWFADLFAQRNGAAGTTSVNGRVRWNLAEGHDLWLVFDHQRSEPTRDLSAIERHGITVKYVRPFSR